VTPATPLTVTQAVPPRPGRGRGLHLRVPCPKSSNLRRSPLGDAAYRPPPAMSRGESPWSRRG